VPLLAAIALLAAAVGLTDWATLPGPGSGTLVQVDWRGPCGPAEAARVLSERGLVGRPRLLALYLWLVGDCRRFEAGPHLLNDALAPRELVQRLARAPGRGEVSVTLPEGYTHLQTAERLEHNEICPKGAFVRAARAPELLRQLGIPGETAEGYLFPATYRLQPNTPAEQVIPLLVAQTRLRLRKLEQRHPGALTRLGHRFGWTEHEVLTLASIVEKEARHDDERPRVASVYFNRLTDPQFTPARRLQADPTAAYGCLIAPEKAPSCARFSGRVTPEMLRDPKNRYNTYKHEGLPPGPIANPGEPSLEAVLAPAKTEYLFFVAKRDGRHTFSRTFQEHRRAVRPERLR
jgi:UPF0755 protein